MSRGVAFEIEHYVNIELRPQENLLIGRSDYAFQKVAAMQAMGMMNTLLAQDTIVAIYGYIPMWEGTYEAFVIPSIHVPRHSILFMKELLEWRKILEQTLTMTRLQTHSIADDLHDRFMTKLGFHSEGTLEKFAYGLDHRIWARVY